MPATRSDVEPVAENMEYDASNCLLNRVIVITLATHLSSFMGETSQI